MELYLQETLRKTITFIPIQKFIKNFYLIYGLSKQKENFRWKMQLAQTCIPWKEVNPRRRTFQIFPRGKTKRGIKRRGSETSGGKGVGEDAREGKKEGNIKKGVEKKSLEIRVSWIWHLLCTWNEYTERETEEGGRKREGKKKREIKREREEEKGDKMREKERGRDFGFEFRLCSWRRREKFPSKNTSTLSSLPLLPPSMFLSTHSMAVYLLM